MVVGEFTQETDLLILGGGPGGYHAAFRAAAHGIQTTIVDAGDGLGGDCLHRGCIPSKTLLSLAETIHAAAAAQAESGEMGWLPTAFVIACIVIAVLLLVIGFILWKTMFADDNRQGDDSKIEAAKKRLWDAISIARRKVNPPKLIYAKVTKATVEGINCQ